MAMRERPREDSREKVREQEREAKLKRMQEIEKRLQQLEQEAPASQGTETRVKVPTDLFQQEIQALKEGFEEPLEETLPPEAWDDIENELKLLEQEIAHEVAPEVISLFDRIRKLHPWIAEKRYEFMYAMPPDRKSRDYEEWKEEWSQVLFDFTREAVLHVVYTKDLLAEPPFSQFRSREESILEISDHLVKKKLASWLNKKKESLRVYWKSLEEWASQITKWARDNALLDPVLLDDIRESEKQFSNLPKDDLLTIFKILKKQKKADLIKTDTGDQAIQFRF